MRFLSFLIFFLEKINYQRKGIVFISKSFIGNNSKALFVKVSQKSKQVSLLTDNLVQLNKLKSEGFNVQILDSCRAMWKIASAKTVIQDQGNFTEPLKALSSEQITIQMWHGVPLKRMNRMGNITYDAMISTSDYVNDTSLADVIVSRKYFNYGYPRNDLLLTEHDSEDLVLCDMELYDLAKSHFAKGSKVIVYMPTHRESATSIGSTPPPLIPLNFESLDSSLKKLDTRLIVKLHPFVKQFQDMHMPKKGYENIHFHSAEGDIYPLLKYTDILITDYSSIYFDFLLLDRPIIFFSYDYEEYSTNMNGFVYDYESFAPGPKVKTEKELVAEIEKQANGEDKHRTERKFVRDKFYTHQDAKSSSRICEKFNLLN
jgi:CDP-glycerol glycerophosphotransferase (TagB/SpsB family)